jgi:hypothetical protein
MAVKANTSNNPLIAQNQFKLVRALFQQTGRHRSLQENLQTNCCSGSELLRAASIKTTCYSQPGVSVPRETFFHKFDFLLATATGFPLQKPKYCKTAHRLSN